MRDKLALLVMLGATAALAQSPQATIRVEVSSASAPVQDAEVSANGKMVRTGQDRRNSKWNLYTRQNEARPFGRAGISVRRTSSVIFTAVSRDADHSYVFVKDEDGLCIACVLPDMVNNDRFSVPGNARHRRHPLHQSETGDRSYAVKA